MDAGERNHKWGALPGNRQKGPGMGNRYDAEGALGDCESGRGDEPTFQNLPRTTCGALVPGCAMLLAVNWTRFNSCSDTSPSRRPSSIWVASRSCVTQSTTRWE